jgi:predicted alpha/beta-hydrolase family hydrolase
VTLPSGVRLLPTPVGPARLHVDNAPGPAGPDASHGLMLLGHGAGGGVEAPDLLAARTAALDLDWTVIRVEQPWRVRGARVAEAPPRLDAAWLAVCATLDSGLPLVVGGRSSGARVACRTAEQVGAAGVLALAFPLVPPGRPDRSRLPELAAPRLPRLVVQGARDAFGVPPALDGATVHVVRGADHSFAVRRKDGRSPAEVATEVRETVRAWLRDLSSGMLSGPQTET